MGNLTWVNYVYKHKFFHNDNVYYLLYIPFVPPCGGIPLNNGLKTKCGKIEGLPSYIMDGQGNIAYWDRVWHCRGGTAILVGLLEHGTFVFGISGDS